MNNFLHGFTDEIVKLSAPAIASGVTPPKLKEPKVKDMTHYPSAAWGTTKAVTTKPKVTPMRKTSGAKADALKRLGIGAGLLGGYAGIRIGSSVLADYPDSVDREAQFNTNRFNRRKRLVEWKKKSKKKDPATVAMENVRATRGMKGVTFKERARLQSLKKGDR